MQKQAVYFNSISADGMFKQYPANNMHVDKPLQRQEATHNVKLRTAARDLHAGGVLKTIDKTNKLTNKQSQIQNSGKEHISIYLRRGWLVMQKRDFVCKVK
jgi:hypothetical protein